MPLKLSRSILVRLIIFNLFLTLGSLFYDAPILPSIPLWAWVFVVVCPLYPLILALFWYKKLHGNDNPYLTAFAIIPTATYGLAASLYYPILMHATYFNWADTGNIAWVWLYGIQGWWLMKVMTPTPKPVMITAIFIVASFTVQYFTLSYSYLEYASIPTPTRLPLFLAGIVMIFMTVFAWYKRYKVESV